VALVSPGARLVIGLLIMAPIVLVGSLSLVALVDGWGRRL
jgi:hypothetical protein